MTKDNVNKDLAQSIINIFTDLEDPRVEGKCSYPLIEIIVIVLCSLICGAKYWSQMEEFAHQRKKWLKKFLKLKNGIPSFKTLSRVMALIPAETFEACFRLWAESIREKKSLEVIAIDGKTLRKSSHDEANLSAAHLVNAFASQNGITVAVERTPDKSNEIKAIPKILNSLDVSDSVITIDAMGCQKGIAKLIRMRDAHYVLALKKNHKRFYKKVAHLFKRAEELDYNAMVLQEHLTRDSDHSRGERREYTLLPIMYLPQYKEVWKDLETLIQVKCRRFTTKGSETVCRYFISSLSIKSHLRASSAIREHWGIENRLHWKLDVSFKEDQSRVRNLNAPQNLSSLRKVALYYLESEQTNKGSIESKQWKAALNTKYLEKILNF
jgi:predicted transposase YbfD/YdcC